MRTLEKDVLLICKNWYNQTLYKSCFEALEAYYKKYYNTNVEFTKKLCIESLLRPTLLHFSNVNPNYIIYTLLSESFTEMYLLDNNENITYEDRLCIRILDTLMEMSVKEIDLSDYKEIFEAEDDDIGVI